MILDYVLHELRQVEKGYRLLHKPLAKEAADTIEMLADKTRYLEEKNKDLKEQLIDSDRHIQCLTDILEGSEEAGQ